MTARVLYKYRACEPWEFFLDILINNRLYAAKFTSLNDPMEGVFTYSPDSATPSFVEQMLRHKQQFGICSLSETHNNTLMWSYYAAGHQGVVLGVEVPKKAPGLLSTDKVEYMPENVFEGFLGSHAEREARRVLARKLSAWRHEKEVRVFSQSSFVPIAVKEAYLGCLMPESRKQLVRGLIKQLNPKVKVVDMAREGLDCEFR